MADTKVEERHEVPAEEIKAAVKDPVKDAVEAVSTNVVTAATGDDMKASIKEAAETLEEVKVEALPEDREKNTFEDVAAAVEVEEAAKDVPKTANAKDQAEASTQNEASSETQVPSKNVQEGQRWNNRDREKHDYRKNIKSDLTSQAESDDPVEIRKQVEFYFSDSNLLVDRFLFSKVEGHANLPVPLSIVHSFQRMRHFQPFSAIVAALRDSKILNLVDNDSCVQRKVPLREGLRDKPMDEIQKVYEDEAMARSVYAKGFGEEVPSTQFDIEAFFADYGPTNSVRLRRTHQKSFKGSVFVEFDSEETQKTFLALEPKPKWKGGDLVIKSKKQYCDDKVDDIREGRIPPNQRGGKMFKPRGDRRGGGNTNGGDDRDWRSRREDDRKGGFNDKNGGRQHRGFGRSGRGGGRGGGKGRSGRDRDGRDDEHKFDQRPKERDEHQIPKVGTTLPSPTETSFPPVPPTTKSTSTIQAPATEQPSISTTSSIAPADTKIPDAIHTQTATSITPESKKRAHDVADDNCEGQGAAKKPHLKINGDDS